MRADNYAVFREHLKLLGLPNKPKLMLDGTISAFRMWCAYWTMDGRDPAKLLKMQAYNPINAKGVR